MSKIINLDDFKNEKFRKKYIIYFVLVVIFIYILFSMYLLIKSSTDTVVVESGVVSQEETLTGYIIRDEQVITGENYKNGITPIISEGERAAKGEIIFRYSGNDEEEINAKIEELNLQIQEALSNQKTLYSADIKSLEETIDKKIESLNSLTNVSEISEYKKEIEELITKKAKIAGSLSQSGTYIQELTAQKEAYEEQLTENSEYITAPESGVVSYRVDGLESVLTTDDFSSLTEESLENLGLKTGKIVSTSQESGKIIDNFNCYVAAVFSSDMAKQAEVEDDVTLTLSSGTDVTAEIVYISEQESRK